MIVIDKSIIEKTQKMLHAIPNGANRAVSAALNKTAQYTKGVFVKQAASSYIIHQKKIRSRLRVFKASPNKLVARVESQGRPIALTEFKTNPRNVPKRRQKNLIATVKRGGGGLIQRAFLVKFKTGHIAVVNRRKGSRLKLVQRYGPSIPQMLNNENVVLVTESLAETRFEQLLEHEIYRIEKGYGK